MNSRQWNMHSVRCLRAEALANPEIAMAAAPVREAKAFAHILENMPIFRFEGDLIAGDFGWRESDAEALAKRFPVESAAPAPPGATVESHMHEFFHCFGGYSPAHTCIDYAKLLRRGLVGMTEDIAAAGGGEYRQAMTVALNALSRFAERHAAMLERAGEPVLADRCRRVPRLPATGLSEAVQSVWFAHLAIGMSELSDASLSLGRFDQYAYPYYRHSLEQGESETELEEQFAALVDKLNRYGDAACALNLGGMDADGRDVCNALTRMIVRVVRKKKLPAPILAARIHPGVPQDLFDALTDPELFAIGQPTFYGEIPCRAALRERGVPESALANWAANSCMGLVVEGREVSNMWGAVVNFLLPLELTVNHGRPFDREMPLEMSTPPVDRFDDFEALETQCVKYLAELVDFCLRACLERTDDVRSERPNPYVSALLNPCTESGKDRLDGGADYHVAIVEAFGLVNAADALTAIKKLVFEQRDFDLEQLVAAAKRNFDDGGDMLRAICAQPKFGNGHAEADAMAARLADDFQRMVRRRSTAAVTFAPSFHTLNAHVGAGKKFGASLDGRRAGEPLAKNVGVRPGSAIEGLTALVRSAAAIEQKHFFGGQALDLSLPANSLREPGEKRKVQALVQTYFSLGGLQIQVNGLTAETLANAIACPEDYRDLIVRIGGYSDYFNNLGPDVRREMVARAEKGL